MSCCEFFATIGANHRRAPLPKCSRHRDDHWARDRRINASNTRASRTLLGVIGWCFKRASLDDALRRGLP
jgi:hypothetical protein